jgi:biopolymer transport protein ExbB/TolQ
MQRKGMTVVLFFGGVGLAAYFYAILWVLVKQGPVFDFFCRRGWYQYGSMIFFLFGLLLVLGRSVMFRKEFRAIEMPVPAKTITPEEAAALPDRIPTTYRRSLLGRRLADLLRGYARQEEIGPLVDRLAANDREELERSASILSWVRTIPPVLGLLGTLDGLRGGISKISGISNVQDIEELRRRLQEFANHSSTAFDTTLLGISCALVLSAAIFFLRKMEDSHLSKLDRIACDVARKFQTRSRLEESLREAAQGAMAGFLQGLDQTLSGATTRILETFRKEMQDGISATARGWLTSWQDALSKTSREILDRLHSSNGDGAGREEHLKVMVGKLDAIERVLSHPRPLQLKISADQHAE